MRYPWVQSVISARNWLEHGCLKERIGMPDAVMVSAIDRLDRGYAERLDYEREQQKKPDEDGD